MPVNTSIYQTQQPVQTPDVGAMAQRALALSNMGMQNQQAQYELQKQQALRNAYSGNVDPNGGGINYQGVISQLGQSGFGDAAMQVQQQQYQRQKARAEAQQQQMASLHAQATATVPVYKYLLGMSDDQAQQAYPQMVKNLADNGVNVANLPPSWNREAIQRGSDVASQYKEQLENQLIQANTDKANQEANMVGVSKGAEELGKYNEDVNNPTTRKLTGSLASARDRADRLISLANAGAQPNETPQARLARLNAMIPQLANEYNAGLSYLFQGGQPSETQLKETGLDTVQSKIAALKQKITGAPSPGDQGALIEAYIDASKKLRDFSAGRLQEISSRSRAAYPFANKYFSKEMDRIGQPIQAPADSAGPMLAGGQGGSGFSLIPSANADSTDKTAQNKPDYQGAMNWLKTADPASPKAFKVRSILKKQGVL